MITILLRVFAWCLAAAVAFATLGPPGYRPHSNLGQDGEHALAFVLLGLAFGLAYTSNRWLTAVLAGGLTGALRPVPYGRFSGRPDRRARTAAALDARTPCAAGRFRSRRAGRLCGARNCCSV